jgi:hypothetical protein
LISKPLIHSFQGNYFLTTLLFLMALTVSLVQRVEAVQTIHYVTTSGSDSGNCSSSSSPCRTIQYAVNQSSSGDQILVAQGTYTYNGSVDQCTFLQTPAVVCVLDKSLSILGGYSTNDWTTAQPSTNPTYLEGQDLYRGVAVIGYNTNTTSLDMEGFTIQNSRTQGPTYLNPYTPGAMGAGMLVQKAVITLKDMVIKNNRAYGANTSSGDGGSADGAGIRIESSPPGTSSLMQRVSFVNNQSYGGTGPDRGGVAFGALFIYDSTVVIENSQLRNNIAQGGNSTGSGTSSTDGLQADALGGGVGVENGLVTLRKVEVTGNQVAGGNAAGLAGAGYGGGILVEGTSSFTSSLTMSDCYLANNSATGGNALTGGNSAGGGLVATNSTVNIERVKLIANSSIGGNSTGGGNAGTGAGGGSYIFATRSGVPQATLTNVMMTDNFANQGAGVTSIGNGGGGGIVVHGMDATISHATIARNRIGTILIAGQGLLVQNWALPSTSLPASVNLNYSIVADHTAGGSLAAAVVIQKGSTLTFNRGLFAGNIKDTNANNSPVAAGTINGLSSTSSASSAGFVSPGSPNYDYHILSSSPAKDKAIGSTITTDIDNQVRPFGSYADLGADEYEPSHPGSFSRILFLLLGD